MSTDGDVGFVKLPNGFLTEEGQWIRFARLREMLGVEEEIFLDRQHARDGATMEMVFRNCVQELLYGSDDAPTSFTEDKGQIARLLTDLYLSDSTYLVVRLRQLSLGPEFSFDSQCAACGVKAARKVMLDDQPLRMREEIPQRTYTAHFRGKALEFRMLTLADNRRMVAHSKQNPDQQLTYRMFLQCVGVDGKKPGSPDDIRRWSLGQRDAFRAAVDEQEYGIDVEVDNLCKACGTDYRLVLPLTDERFFFPSGLKRR